MGILRQAAEQQILKPLKTYGWSAEIFSEHVPGEYLIIRALKLNVEYKVALMYSSATDNRYYKLLDTQVEHIFTNGELYKIESYAFGIETKVTPISNFFPLMIEWSRSLSPPKETTVKNKTLVGSIQITAEKPIDGVWAHLSQLASTTLAKKLIARRAIDAEVALTETQIESKAEGVAFSIRNAADYFKSATNDSLNKRVLSLYYGSLALAFAEMLAAPHGPMDLDEVEGMTKYGHGLYTVASNTNDFGGLTVGVLATGFYPRWASFLGHDVTGYPKKKATSASDLSNLSPGSSATLEQIFSTFPELAKLFEDVYDSEPSWIHTAFDSGAGFRLTGTKTGSSYINLIDHTFKIGEDRLKENRWALTEIETVMDDEGHRFRARVDHDGFDYWHEALPLHHSSFFQGNALILPVLGGIYEYRAISLSLLYALSILVRYMPSAWRRVEGGDWDQHLALVKMVLDVFERVLPQQFLESVTNKKIRSNIPGAF